MPRAQAQRSSPRQEPPTPGRVASNLALLSALGVGISSWVWLYTDLFPVLAGLLGMGGVFVWIAFLSGLLTDERKTQFQRRLDASILQGSQTWKWLGGAAVASLAIASQIGTVVLLSPADDRPRAVHVGVARITATSLTAYDPEPLRPGAASRHAVWTFWRRREVRVKVTGLPAAHVRLHPFARERLIVPSSFHERAVVLARPTARVGANAESGRLTLVVERNGAEIGRFEPPAYRGEAVWIGCDADVSIPQRQIDLWRLQLVREGKPEEVLARWTPSLAIAEDVRFDAGDRVVARLLRTDGGTYAQGAVTVRLPSGGQDFVHDVEIDYQ